MITDDVLLLTFGYVGALWCFALTFWLTRSSNRTVDQGLLLALSGFALLLVAVGQKQRSKDNVGP